MPATEDNQNMEMLSVDSGSHPADFEDEMDRSMLQTIADVLTRAGFEVVEIA